MDSDGKTVHWQLSTDNIGNSVLDRIEDAVTRTSFGVATMIVQDGHLIQVEIVEKIRFVSAESHLPLSGAANPNPVLRSKILQALMGLKFGQVTLTIKNGKVTQIERNERTRWNRLEGIHGDGI